MQHTLPALGSRDTAHPVSPGADPGQHRKETTVSCARNESKTLPAEILSQIIRACIEPYSVRVHQRAYTEADFPAILDHTYTASSNDDSPTDEECSFKPFKYHETALVFIYFTQTAPEYVSGLPNLTNIKLVNKLFYYEISSAARDMFDGTLSIETGKQFFTGSRVAEWKTNARIFGGWTLSWLKSRVTSITFSEKRTAIPDACILDDKQLPNLRQVIVRARNTDRHFSGGEDKLLTGEADHVIIQFLERNMRRKTRAWLNFEGLYRRGVSILFEFHFWANSRSASTGTFRVIAYCFRIQVLNTGTSVILERREAGDGLRW